MEAKSASRRSVQELAVIRIMCLIIIYSYNTCITLLINNVVKISNSLNLIFQGNFILDPVSQSLEFASLNTPKKISFYGT